MERVAKRKNYCYFFYEHSEGCKRDSECTFLHDKTIKPHPKEITCFYYMHDQCKKGAECPNSHENPKRESRSSSMGRPRPVHRDNSASAKKKTDIRQDSLHLIGSLQSKVSIEKKFSNYYGCPTTQSLSIEESKTNLRRHVPIKPLALPKQILREDVLLNQKMDSSSFISKPKTSFRLVEQPQRSNPNRNKNTFSIHSDDENIDLTKIAELTKLSMILSPNEIFEQDFKLSRKKLQLSSSQDKIEKLLFTLQIKPFMLQEKINRVPVDVICVLDVSGSMAGTKIELLKQSLRRIVFDFLVPEDRLSLITFSNVAKKLTPLRRVSEEHAQELDEIIDKITASGTTSITAGMNLTLDVLEGRKYKNTVSTIFLLSDGQDDDAKEGIQNLLKKKCVGESFTINTFGYGNDHDPSLMDSISRIGHGNFYPIAKLADLDFAFVDALGSSISVKGLNVNISIQSVKSELFPSIAIRKGYGGEEMWEKINDTYNTREIQFSSTKNYVLEIVIPKCNKKLRENEKVQTIAKAKVTLSLPNSGQIWESEHDLTVELLNEDEKDESNKIASEVFKEYYRVLLAEKAKEAQSYAENKFYEKAQNKLKDFKTELSNSVVKYEQFALSLMKETESIILQMEPSTFQEGGRHRLYQQILSHEKEKSSLFVETSRTEYANEMQKSMRSKLEEIKADNCSGPRYFVIKSYSEKHVEYACENDIWCSTFLGNKRLDEAFRKLQNKYPLYLFFSINQSKRFLGVCKMVSPVDFNSRIEAFASKWRGSFKIEWINIKDVPYTNAVWDLRIDSETKVPQARDAQEIPASSGEVMLRIFKDLSDNEER